MQLRSSITKFFKRFGCSPKEQVAMQQEINKTATRQQVAEVVLSLARKKVAEAELEEQCEMHLNRLQVQVEAFQPLESRLDGHIARIFRHVDLVIPIALLCVLSATVARGQNVDPFKAQRACYVEAQKATGENPLLGVNNHYDARTKTCWITKIEHFVSHNDFPLPPNQFRLNITIWNAFERQPTALYLGPDPELDHKSFKTDRDACNVDGIECRSLDGFYKMVNARHPGVW
jgi:hypothetical protein